MKIEQRHNACLPSTCHSLDNHSACWPPSRPVLGLFCCGQTLSGRKVEIGRAEREKAREEGAEKELTRSDGEIAPELIHLGSWGGLWDTHSTISLRQYSKIRRTQNTDFFLSLESRVQCLWLHVFLTNLCFVFILYNTLCYAVYYRK